LLSKYEYNDFRYVLISDLFILSFDEIGYNVGLKIHLYISS